MRQKDQPNLTPLDALRSILNVELFGVSGSGRDFPHLGIIGVRSRDASMFVEALFGGENAVRGVAPKRGF